MTPGRGHHVALPIAELEVAADWFRARFDAVVAARGGWPGHTFLRLSPPDRPADGGRIELFENDSPAFDELAGAEFEVTIGLPDAPRTVETLRDGGVEVGASSRPDGTTVHRFQGPGHTTFAVVERPVDHAWTVDHVAVRHPTPDEVVAWYTEHLGWAADDTNADGAVLRPAGDPLGMGLVVRRGDPSPIDPDPWLHGHVGIACDRLDSFLDTLVAGGVDRSGIRVSCGGTRASIPDAPGVPVELVERPSGP